MHAQQDCAAHDDLASRNSVGAICGFGADHLDAANAGGHQAVSEFELKAGSCDDIPMDDAASPGAAINANAMWGQTLLIEPSTPHPILAVAEHPDGVDGVPGRDQNTVPALQILLADRLQCLCVRHGGFQRVHVPSPSLFAPFCIVRRVEARSQCSAAKTTAKCRRSSFELAASHVL